jgi:transposase
VLCHDCDRLAQAGRTTTRRCANFVLRRRILDGVRVIGVDEHRWAHTHHAAGDGYVTVIVDLTAVVAGTGRARLLDLVPGRSAAALSGWLAERDQAFRQRVEVVAVDGFGGYKNAATAAFRRGHRDGPVPRRRGAPRGAMYPGGVQGPTPPICRGRSV